MENTRDDTTALISVIVPVYKAEHTIGRCVESIIGQTYRNLELILVDDGSPDKSGLICDEYAGMDTRVVAVHTSNCGVSAARNQGLEQARGEFVAFVDSDDYVDRTFLADAYDDITRYQADLSISGVQTETFKYGEMIGSELHRGKDKDYTLEELLDAFDTDYPFICICGVWCKLYRTEIVRKFAVRFDTGLALGEDTAFNCDYFQHARTVRFSSKVHYHYFRGNNDSLFSKYSKDLYDISENVYDKMRALMKQNQCAPDSLRRFDALYAHIMVGCIHHEYLFYDKSSPQSRKKVIRKVSANPYIHRSLLRNFKNPKDILVMALLKARMCGMVHALLNIHYHKD